MQKEGFNCSNKKSKKKTTIYQSSINFNYRKKSHL